MGATEPALTPDSELALAGHVRAERVRFVFIQSLLPIIFSPLAGAVLSVVLWHAVEHRRLVIWTSGLVAIAMLRTVLMRLFPRVLPDGPALVRWERAFVASILLVDLWWGVGALFLLVPGALTESALVFCFVMLMAGGHTASYSAHPATVNLGVLALTVPITIWFAFKPDKYHWAMAFISIMFLAASFRSIKTLGFFFNRTYRLAHELEIERDRAELLARSDFLTGLNNRRAFYERSEQELRQSIESGADVAVAMLDIDHFKSINDRFGHAAGDVVIRTVADSIRQSLAPGQFAGRLGGEEFAVFLPGASVQDAHAFAHALVLRVSTLVVQFESHAIGFTISAGVAARRDEATLDELIAQADAALYSAKRGGRNRVMANDAGSASPEPVAADADGDAGVARREARPVH